MNRNNFTHVTQLLRFRINEKIGFPTLPLLLQIPHNNQLIKIRTFNRTGTSSMKQKSPQQSHFHNDKSS